MSAIYCHQLSKELPDKTKILQEIDLTVEEGEFVMVLGPPGAGKSTFLSVLGGLDLQVTGECLIFGQNLAKMSPEERASFRAHNMGFVFQNLHLIPSMTAYENVILPLVFAGVPNKSAKEQVDELFYQLGIEERKKAYPRELSQGENQLIALARSLSARPRLLLLNEPTSFLDHAAGVRVMTTLRESVVNQLLTVVAITSDIRLHPFAHRIVRMRGGQIVSIVGEASTDAAPFLKI